MDKIITLQKVDKDTRWKATVTYEVDNGEKRKVVHYFEELYELQELIESGPTFCAIRSFKIEYQGPKETIKEAMES